VEDFRIQIGFLGHFKTRKLRRRLGSQAVESFLWLWEFCSVPAHDRTDGDLSGMSVDDIEAAANWSGEPCALVEALLEVGYLERTEDGVKIHDWEKHQPYVATYKRRSAAGRRAARKRWSGRGQSDDDAEGEDGSGMAPACDSHGSGMAPACDSHGSGMRLVQKGNAVGTKGQCPIPIPIPISNPNPNSHALRNASPGDTVVVPAEGLQQVAQGWGWHTKRWFEKWLLRARAAEQCRAITIGEVMDLKDEVE
jgi:hypothetical protein